MTKTESANRTVQAVVIEACEQLLECQMSTGARLAIPNTGNLIMVGTPEWIAKNVPGVDAMVEGGELGDDQWIFDLAVDHESRGNGIYGPITFSSTGLVDFVRAVCTRLAATTQASTAQAEREPDWFGHHSALSKCAEMLDNMSDGDKLVETPKFLAEKLASFPRSQRECFACDWKGETDLMLGAIGPLCPSCGETTELATSSTDAQAAAEVRDAWTSVDERLPEDCQDVLVLCPDTGCEPAIWSAQWLAGSKTFESNSNGWADLEDISHWMPRPIVPNALRSAGDTGGAR